MDASKNSSSGWNSPSLPPVRPLPHPMPTPEITPTPIPMPMPADGLCDDMVLVMSYVKMQQWDQVYEAETALERGTIFPELDLPFVGEGACPHDE